MLDPKCLRVLSVFLVGSEVKHDCISYDRAHRAELKVLEYRGVGHELARLAGVNVTRARKSVVRLREARGLALIALVRGDKEEVARIMAHARGRAGKTKPPAIDAAKEQ